MSEQEAMAKIVLANGSVMYVSDEDAKKFLRRQLTGTTKSKKTSVNGAAIVPEVSENEGVLTFKHPDYKSRSFPTSIIESAKVEADAGNFTDVNKHTQTRFVRVEGRPIGENLIKAAVVGGFIE